MGQASSSKSLTERKCFINGHPVTAEDVEFDHIVPFAEGGKSEVANIGAVCKKHNREKGTLSLSE